MYIKCGALLGNLFSNVQTMVVSVLWSLVNTRKFNAASVALYVQWRDLTFCPDKNVPAFSKQFKQKVRIEFIKWTKF